MVRAFLDLILSRECAGCLAPDVALCSVCQRSLDRALPRLTVPRPEPPGMPLTWAAAPYAGVAGSVIVAWKDADRRDLGTALAPLLSRAIAAALVNSPAAAKGIGAGRSLVLVPIPSRPASVRSRGRWPLADLVTAVRRQTPRGLRVRSVPALRIKGQGRDQVGLSESGRAQNMHHAMELDPRHVQALQGGLCILADDIVTTGSTLSEGARVLQAAGVPTVLAATVAATARRGPR